MSDILTSRQEAARDLRERAELAWATKRASLRAEFGCLSTPIAAKDGLEFLWWEQSPDDQDLSPLEKGYLTHMVEVCEGTERIGYLRISYTTKALMAKVFPTPLHFKREHGGWCFDPTAEPEQLWKSLNGYAGFGGWNSVYPGDQQAQVDIDALVRRTRKEMSQWHSWASIPNEAYARVEPSHQRRGIATQMYVQAAKKLAARDLFLRASTNQTADAQGLWRHLHEDPQFPTELHSFKRQRDPETFLVLDYR